MPAWKQPLDPQETLDFVMDFGGLLDSDETIVSKTVEPDAASNAAGLRVNSSEVLPDARSLKVWLSIDPANQGDAGWQRGKRLFAVGTVTTTANRTRQRSYRVRVRSL